MANVPATEFKAKCLELMDRVAERRETYVITKRGKPVAKLVPADRPRKKSIFGCMADETTFVGDVGRPAYSDDEWKQFERQRLAQAKAWDHEWQRYGTISGKQTLGRPPRLTKRKAGRPKAAQGAKR